MEIGIIVGLFSRGWSFEGVFIDVIREECVDLEKDKKKYRGFFFFFII